MTFVDKDKTYIPNYRKSRISQMAIDFKSFEVFVSPKKRCPGQITTSYGIFTAKHV